jgi:Protein of unknown function (DUF2514)
VNPLALIPSSWLLPIAGIAGALMAATIGVQTLRVHSAQADLAKVQQAWDKERAAAITAARTAEQKARADEQRMAADNLENLNEAERLAARTRANAVAVAAAGAGLRERAAGVAARCDRGPEAAATASSGSPAAGAGDLLADVLGRLEAAGGQLALEADRRGAAGRTCERYADSVTR